MENPKIRICTDFDIEERVQAARDNFRVHGYNCCQAVLLAYADVIGLDPQTAAVLTSGFAYRPVRTSATAYRPHSPSRTHFWTCVTAGAHFRN